VSLLNVNLSKRLVLQQAVIMDVYRVCRIPTTFFTSETDITASDSDNFKSYINHVLFLNLIPVSHKPSTITSKTLENKRRKLRIKIWGFIKFILYMK
jgi:hypothetical protein